MIMLATKRLRLLMKHLLHKNPSRNIYFLLYGIIAIAALRYLFLNPISPDSWTHMAIGRIIVEQNSIPRHAEISFKQSSPSLEWISHSWLSDAIIFLSSSIDLRLGTLLLLIPILAATILFLYLILKSLNQSDFAIFTTVSAVTIIFTSFFRLHPLSLILPLLLVLFYSYCKWYQNDKKYIVLWPIVFVLWANLAGGFIFIPALFCICIVITELVRAIGFKEKHGPSLTDVFKLSAILGASFVASLFNPLGLRIWFYIFTLIGILQTKDWLSTLPGSLLVINQSFIRQSASSLTQFVFVIYAGIIILSSFILIVHRKLLFVKQLLIYIPCMVLLLLGFLWIRFIPLSALAAAPAFGFILTTVTDTKTKGRIFQYMICACLLTLGLYVLFFPPRSFEFTYPQTQVDLLKKFDLPRNTLTTPDLTGFVLYNLPERKVLLDAHDDLFDENETLGILYLPNQISPETLDYLTKTFSINTVLVSKDLGGFSTAFNQYPNFSLLYFDYDGFLFVKGDEMPQKFIEENSLLSLDLSRNLGFNPEVATASAKELESFTKKYPNNKLALGQLATIYRYQDNPARAEQTLLKIPRDKWDYIVLTEMGRIKASQGACKESEAYYLEALKDRREQTFSRAILDMAVLYALCFNDKEQAEHYFNRYNSFILDPAEREKVRALAEEMGIELQE